MTDYEAHIRRLYRAVSDGTLGDRLSAFFHSDAEQIEYPSLVRPHGHSRSLGEMMAGAERGIELVRDQRFEVFTVVQDGDQVAVQLTWRATLASGLRGLPAGTPLVAHVAAFYEFRDGLILRQSSYDCYEPIGD
jgi:ketosteroid isomerase-like protein